MLTRILSPSFLPLKLSLALFASHSQQIHDCELGFPEALQVGARGGVCWRDRHARGGIGRSGDDGTPSLRTTSVTSLPPPLNAVEPADVESQEIEPIRASSNPWAWMSSCEGCHGGEDIKIRVFGPEVGGRSWCSVPLLADTLQEQAPARVPLVALGPSAFAKKGEAISCKSKDSNSRLAICLYDAADNAVKAWITMVSLGYKGRF